MAVVGYEHLDVQTNEGDVESNRTTQRTLTGLLDILQTDIRLSGRVGVSVGVLCAVLILLNIVLLICLSRSNTKESDPLVTEFPGWQRFGGGCYYISAGETSWENSRQWCRDRQSDLIVINSKEKQDFVSGLYQTLWLGLTDKVEEDLFKWVDGTTLTSLTFWSPGQPDNRKADTNATQECVVFDTKSGGWTDVFCFRSFRWICEKVQC